jgi:hypothetical protein
MREHVTEEGFRYRIDASGRILWLHTNHPKELADSLEVLARELARTRKDLHAWKWAVIAAHNALQNILADCAAHDRAKPQTREQKALVRAEKKYSEAETDEEREKALQKVMKKLYAIIRGGRRTANLRGVVDLFATVKKRWKLKPPHGTLAKVKALNAARNDFVHFGAAAYEFDIGSFPDIISMCIDWVEHLGWHTQLVMWFDDETKTRARRAIIRCQRLLKKLRAEYDA